MTRLVDDVELSDELWEELIGSMQTRMQDKVPAVRVNAARALARLVSGDENDSTVTVYRQALETDRSAVTISFLINAIYRFVNVRRKLQLGSSFVYEHISKVTCAGCAQDGYTFHSYYQLDDSRSF